MTRTYWNNAGKHQDKYNEMIMAEWNTRFTKESQATARRYRRYYNDGDIPRGMMWETQETIERTLEEQADQMIEREWKRYQKAEAEEAAKRIIELLEKAQNR